MTLCLAWKVNNEINLLSDSRLTAGNEIITNNANKVFTIYANAFTGNVIKRQSIFLAKYGLCFAGSYLNGSILADTISELTSEIFVEDTSQLSFNLLTEIAFFVFENVTRHLMEINNEKGLSEVFFSGIDPQSGQTKLAKFSCKLRENQVIFLNEQIQFENNEIFYLGNSNAIEKAKQLEQKLNNSYTHFHLLSDIIEDTSIHEVGGCIQYGCVLQGNFRTYGIVDFDYFKVAEINVYQMKTVYSFRSLPMNLQILRINNLKCRIGKIYMSPFNDRQQIIEEKIKKLNNKK